MGYAHKIEVQPGGVIHLELPELMAGEVVWVSVEKAPPQDHPPQKSLIGWAKGKMWIADDFDATPVCFENHIAR
jgi:hypothetical protein